MKKLLGIIMICLMGGAGLVWGQDEIADEGFVAENGGGTVVGNEPQYAVVNLSVDFLRLKPDYESALESQLLMGTVVQILEEDGYWRKIQAPDYTAWCTSLGLALKSPQEIEEYNAAAKYICTAWHSTVYSEASDKSQKICDLVEGDLLLRVANPKGSGKWMVSKGFAAVALPDGTEGFVCKEDVEYYEEWTASRNPTAENIISEAMKFVGVPYMWGGASPNAVDCSGFVQHVYKMNGVTIPRNSSQQYAAGREVPLIMTLNLVYDEAGKRQQMIQKLSNAQPGDLLFFGRAGDNGNITITHVGLYLGDGRMIHSSHIVRVNSLLPGDPDCYENADRLLCAARFLPDQN